MIVVRQADESDAELIADMSRVTFYDTFAESNSPENMNWFMNEKFTRENLIAEVGAPRNIFLLAYLNNIPAGYARIRTEEKAFEIARIYALKEFIGKGIGRALMEYCIRLATENKKEFMWLGVWEHNPHAIRFYKNFGFEKTGEHVFMLGNDPQTDWVMKKTL